MVTGRPEASSAPGAFRPFLPAARRKVRARRYALRYPAGMKTLILLASFAAAHAAAGPCTDRLVPYSAPIDTPEYALAVGTGTGQLRYIGARHSSDPLDPQFAEIEKQWNAQRPQIAFYEGPNRPVPKDRSEAIQQTGESGFVRWLAARDGVPLGRLEPEPKDETTDLLQHFTPEQIGLFFTLREAARLRERRGMGEAEIARSIDGLLERAASMGLGAIPFRNSAEVAQAYARYWQEPARWWQAPTRWFDPKATSADTGGVFTNEVNARSSTFRNITMVQRLSAAVREGKRVFAVVGRDHVAHQAEALRCEFR